MYDSIVAYVAFLLAIDVGTALYSFHIKHEAAQTVLTNFGHNLIVSILFLLAYVLFKVITKEK